MDPLPRLLARTAAYGSALLLSAVWIASALASLRHPLFDIGKAHVGDAIIAFAGALSLSPESTLELAHMLAGVKLLLGAYLLAAVVVAICECVRHDAGGDEMLDLGLFLSAVASIVAAAPALMENEALLRAIGELMLSVIASGLIAYAHEAQVPTPRSRVLTWDALRRAETKALSLLRSTSLFRQKVSVSSSGSG